MENIEILEDMVRSHRNELEKRKERLTVEEEEQGMLEALLEQLTQLEAEVQSQSKAVAERDRELEKVAAQLEKLKAENEGLKEENNSLKMQQKEMGQMQQKLVKKAGDEEVIEAVRTFLNTSKRKNVEKRGYIKEFVFGLVRSAHIDLPADLVDLLEHFDDDDVPKQQVDNHFEANSNCQVFNGEMKENSFQK